MPVTALSLPSRGLRRLAQRCALCFLLVCSSLQPALAAGKKSPPHKARAAAPAAEAAEPLTLATQFDLERYMGLWFKVAKTEVPRDTIRTRERFELLQRYDGSVRVIYTAYQPMDNRWDRIEDYMEPLDSRGPPHNSQVSHPIPIQFRVSRFGPFGDSYTLLALDASYQWAILQGPERRAVFVLARSSDLPPATRKALEQLSTERKFSTKPLRWEVAGSENPPR